MTIKRLVCSCENISPAKTTIVVVSSIAKKELYRGRWTEGFMEKFGELKVLDFNMDEIRKDGSIRTITVFAVKEYVK